MEALFFIAEKSRFLLSTQTAADPKMPLTMIRKSLQKRTTRSRRSTRTKRTMRKSRNWESSSAKPETGLGVKPVNSIEKRDQNGHSKGLFVQCCLANLSFATDI